VYSPQDVLRVSSILKMTKRMSTNIIVNEHILYYSVCITGRIVVLPCRFQIHHDMVPSVTVTKTTYITFPMKPVAVKGRDPVIGVRKSNASRRSRVIGPKKRLRTR